MRKRKMNLVIALPTEHSIVGKLKMQVDYVKIFKLSEKAVVDLSSEESLQKLMEEIVTSVKQLPLTKDDGPVHLLLAGFPLANTYAYEALKKRFGNVSLLFYDTKNRKYLSSEDVPEKTKKIWKAIGGDIENERRKKEGNKEGKKERRKKM